MALPFEQEPASPLVIGAEGCFSREDVARFSAELQKSFRERAGDAGALRVLIQADRPERLLAAMDAAARTEADLWIAHTNLSERLFNSVAGESAARLLLMNEGEWRLGAPEAPSSGRICLMTSGTTGIPKVAAHTLDNLAGKALAAAGASGLLGSRWLLTYQSTAFAGVQVMLTAVYTGGAIVTAASRDPVAWFDAAARHEVTHISGTPTFWRSFLMVAPPGSLPHLRQATLGGEAIDQPTLDRIRQAFPQTRITHIYASTEAGVVFSVNDGLAGFPSAWLEKAIQGVEMRIGDGMLEIRTSRRMHGYLSAHEAQVSEDGWLRTGDRVEISGERVVFLGREDSIINVGGTKVHPQAVEAFLLGLDGVIEARVFGMPNPIAGAVVGAELVVAKDKDPLELRARILSQCMRELDRAQIPRNLKFVDSIRVADSGKKG